MILSPHHLETPKSKKLLSPFLKNMLTMKVISKDYFGSGVGIYNQRRNMIIASLDDKIAHFYDASTLLPVEEREKLELKSPITRISLWPETDSYIFACLEGEVYAYNASSKSLTQLESPPSTSVIFSIAFLGPASYAFSTYSSKAIYVGSLENENLPRIIPQKDDSHSLYYSKIQKTLFSGLNSGDLAVYRTNQLPKLKSICSIKAHKNGLVKIEGGRLKHKEIIITCGRDNVIRIWDLIKGRTKRVKTIILGEMIHDLAYLEEYKMLAVVSGRYSNSVQFFSLISGKFESMFEFGIQGAKRVFVMKDKNAIGVVKDNQTGTIQILQLRKD